MPGAAVVGRSDPHDLRPGRRQSLARLADMRPPRHRRSAMRPARCRIARPCIGAFAPRGHRPCTCCREDRDPEAAVVGRGLTEPWGAGRGGPLLAGEHPFAGASRGPPWPHRETWPSRRQGSLANIRSPAHRRLSFSERGPLPERACARWMPRAVPDRRPFAARHRRASKGRGRGVTSHH